MVSVWAWVLAIVLGFHWGGWIDRVMPDWQMFFGGEAGELPQDNRPWSGEQLVGEDGGDLRGAGDLVVMGDEASGGESLIDGDRPGEIPAMVDDDRRQEVPETAEGEGLGDDDRPQEIPEVAIGEDPRDDRPALESLDVGDEAILGQEVHLDLDQDLGQDLGQDLSQNVAQEIKPDLEQDPGQELTQKDLGQGIKADLGQDSAQEVDLDLGQELNPELSQQELGQQDLGQEVDLDLGQELNPELGQQELGQGIKPDLEQDLGQQLTQQNLDQRIKPDLAQDSGQEVDLDLGQELSQELDQELDQEIKPDLEEDLGQGTKQHLEQELGQKLSQKDLSQEFEPDLEPSTPLGQDEPVDPGAQVTQDVAPGISPLPAWGLPWGKLIQQLQNWVPTPHPVTLNRPESLPPELPHLQEVPPPASLRALANRWQMRRPQVTVLSPGLDQVVESDRLEVRLGVQGLGQLASPEEPGADSSWDRQSPEVLRPFLRVVLDDRPLAPIPLGPEPEYSLTLEGLSPGSHTLRVFAVMPWGESFKNAGAYDQVTFHRYTETPGRIPPPDRTLLTYNSPQGDQGGEPILLDFYLTQAPLHLLAPINLDPINLDPVNPDLDQELLDLGLAPEPFDRGLDSPMDPPLDPEQSRGADWQIRCTINGESFTLGSWEPIYLTGFREGVNWVKLEVVDGAENPLAPLWGSAIASFTYHPGGDDPLARLMGDRATPEELQAIAPPPLK